MTAKSERPPTFLRGVMVLTKARLTLLVLLTTAAGFYLAGVGSSAPTDWPQFFWTMLGTALVAAAAAILNQWIERDVDARMNRTRNRPLPTGQFPPTPALVGGCVAAAVGAAMLARWVNPLAAGLAVLTLAIYLLAYTPLKPATVLNTLVGAIPGAIPPVIGWVGAGRGLDEGAWALFALLFFWQLPHFYAIAWLYRDDYRAASLRMLAVEDATGVRTGRHAVVGAILLIAASLWPWKLELAGLGYAITAAVLGGAQLYLALRFLQQPSDRHARWLFLASVTYLPLVLLALVLL